MALRSTADDDMPRLPPGPRGRFLTGCLSELQRDILGFLTGLVRDYGDVVGFRVLGRPFCMLGHPDHIEQVLVRESDRYIKSFDYRKLAWIVGRGLLTSEGETWRRQRALVQPVFHNDRVRACVPLFVRHTEELLGRWHGRAELEVHEEMSRLALVIVAESLFQSVVDQDVETVGRALEVLSRAFMGFPFPFWLPLPRHVAAWRHLGKLDGVVRRLIRERIEQDARSPVSLRNRVSDDPPASDLLTHLLAARDEAGRPMSSQQLRDELMTVFLAGHETTALGLSFALWLVARHPEVEARLLAEWAAELGNRPVTAADLPRLEYTRAVLNETLRLYPPAWFIGREAATDVTIGGYDVRRGTTIFLIPYIVQRDARFFPEPEQFHPDRWLDDALPKPPRYAYFPFGAGPRSCIGAGFAMLEMASVLPTILRRCRLIDRTGGTLELLPAITLRPRRGINMGLEPRRKLS